MLGVCLWVAVDAFSASSSGDAGFAGVWAVLATAPTSLLVPSEGPVALTGIPTGAFVQAVALGAMYRYITERRARSTANGAAGACPLSRTFSARKAGNIPASSVSQRIRPVPLVPSGVQIEAAADERNAPPPSGAGPEACRRTTGRALRAG